MKLSLALIGLTFSASVALARSAVDLKANHSDSIDLHARHLLTKFPLIDTHVDLPQTMRILGRKPIDEINKLATGYPGHVDLINLKQGHVGAVFLTAWSPCLDYSVTGTDFLEETPSLRDTMEIIDLIHQIADHYPNQITFCTTADCIRSSFANRKLAALIGLEGTHGLGNSLSVMRLFAQLGVRYVTLTHVCHSAFASSNGGGAGTTGASLAPIHPGNGLTKLGRELVKELNRLGVMVDLSHTTDATAVQAIEISQAPVIWSHSGARSIHNHPRNVPDEVLSRIGAGAGKNHGIVLSVLYPVFIDADPSKATIARVVDHVEHIASVCGKAHVGLASDFDGMGSSVLGMEDASKWPDMIAEFIRRGWSDAEIEGLAGGNILRVMDEVQAVREQLWAPGGMASSREIYKRRTDLPAFDWGGPNGAYLPADVKAVVDKKRVRDEL